MARPSSSSDFMIIRQRPSRLRAAADRGTTPHPWEAVQRHMLDRLHEHGFDDLDAAHLNVFSTRATSTRPTNCANVCRSANRRSTTCSASSSASDTSNGGPTRRPALAARRSHTSRQRHRPGHPGGRPADRARLGGRARPGPSGGPPCDPPRPGGDRVEAVNGEPARRLHLLDPRPLATRQDARYRRPSPAARSRTCPRRGPLDMPNA